MKKLTSLLLASVATLLLSTSAFAHGFNASVGIGHVGHGYNNFGHGYNNFGHGYNNFAVRALTFSQPVYASASAFFTYRPFVLVAQPPVVTYAALAPYQPAQVTYQAPADPIVTYPAPAAVLYVAPTYSYGFFGVNQGYAVGSHGFFGVRRFVVYNDSHGVHRFHHDTVRGPVNHVERARTGSRVR